MCAYYCQNDYCEKGNMLCACKGCKEKCDLEEEKNETLPELR
jgi:hypothetical protein